MTRSRQFLKPGPVDLQSTRDAGGVQVDRCNVGQDPPGCGLCSRPLMWAYFARIMDDMQHPFLPRLTGEGGRSSRGYPSSSARSSASGTSSITPRS